MEYYGYTKDSALLVASLLDVIYAVIFLCGILVMRYGQTHRINKRKQGSATIASYSIQARLPPTCLPP